MSNRLNSVYHDAGLDLRRVKRANRYKRRHDPLW